MRTKLQFRNAVEGALGPHWWFFWLGLLCYVFMGIYALNYDVASNEKNLVGNVFLLIVFIPAGITYFVMARKVIEEFGSKLLLALVLALWPKALLVLASVFPFAYLIWKSFSRLQKA